MIEINGIYKSFENNKVLENVSHVFKPGITTAITGHSGKGKTTLINILLGP